MLAKKEFHNCLATAVIPRCCHQNLLGDVNLAFILALKKFHHLDIMRFCDLDYCVSVIST